MGLADSRQLLAAKHVHDAVAADATLQHNDTAGNLFDSADADRGLRDFNLFQNVERRISLRCRDENRKASFVGYVERIQAENLAGALHDFVYRDQSLFQLD